MPKTADKLKKRAELLTILNKYQNNENIGNRELKKDIDVINSFNDKVLVCKILLQEIKNIKSNYANICAVILLETIDTNILYEESVKILNSHIDNEKKFFIISILKQKGIDINLKNISNYIEINEDTAQAGILDFLNNAIEDPEVQIDLLDFFSNLPDEERYNFLENICEDFESDYLGNAFSILCQVQTNPQETDILLYGLIKANSAYSLEGLNFILKNKLIDSKTKSKIRREIKKINLNHPDFQNNAIIADSKIFQTYISFIDGKSNFSLIFSRERKDKSVDAFLITINMQMGITSCMGFGNITMENFYSVVKRLFSDSAPIKITPIALKSLFGHYYKKTQKNNIEIPYELIVWKKLLNDVREVNYDISEFINSKLDITQLTTSKIKKLCSASIMETWYYSLGDNKNIDDFIENIENNHIVELEKINELALEMMKNHFLNNKEFLKNLQSKLLLQSYITLMAKLKMTSACIYSICFNKKYISLFLNSIIDKSLYYYLSTKLYELEDGNLFKKTKPTNFTKDELELIMSQLEEKWN